MTLALNNNHNYNRPVATILVPSMHNFHLLLIRITPKFHVPRCFPFQNYTQLPVQRASPLWHLGQSTWKVQHQQQQATTSPFHIDELYDNQQQVHILNNDIPRHQSVLNETTVSVQTPTTPSRDTSPPQSKSKTVNTQLYKTELCGPFMKTGSCPYGLKCQFAHGEAELKHIERPPKWRSKPCANWSKYGSCRYGNRCCFKHGD